MRHCNEGDRCVRDGCPYYMTMGGGGTPIDCHWREFYDTCRMIDEMNENEEER